MYQAVTWNTKTKYYWRVVANNAARIDDERHLDVHDEVVTHSLHTNGRSSPPRRVPPECCTEPDSNLQNFPVYKRPKISYY